MSDVRGLFSIEGLGSPLGEKTIFLLIEQPSNDSLTFASLMKGTIQILFFVFGAFTQLGDAKALDNKLYGRQFPLASSSDYTFAGETARDYAGYWVSSAGDMDGDGLALTGKGLFTL